MKALPRLAIFASVSLTSLATLTPGRAALVITEVMSSSGLTGSGVGSDWFELTNTGTTNVDLTGFKMDDSSNSFAASVALSFSTLGATATLAPGQSEVFIESPSSDTDVANFRAYWGGIATGAAIGTYNGSQVGLSSTNDDVHIFDAAGNALAGVTFGAATSGTSFDNRAGATTLTVLSTAGVNGAYNAANPGGLAVTDVGSPGAVPEPAAYLWLGLGAAVGWGALRARRTA